MKIGLLIDNKNLDQADSDICSWINKNKNLSIELLIVNNKERFKNKNFPFFRIIDKIVFILLTYIEILFYNFGKKYQFDNFDFTKLNEIEVKPEISKSGFYFSYNEADINRIKSAKLDLIIRMGSGILKGEILESSKFGVISFQHGDNSFFRDGPPCFWEVYSKKPTTGFVIQRLNNTLDGGDIICKGQFPTKHYFFKNKMFIYKKSNYYFKRTLNYIQQNNSLPKINEEKPYFNKLYKSPSVFEIAKYILNTYSFIFIKILKKIILKRVNFSVAFNKQNFKSNVISQSTIIKNPKNCFSADPFLFKFEKQSYLFVEEFHYSKKKAVIAVYLLKGIDYERLGICLEENFHLSFPYIFKFNNEIYMCPETAESGEIRIYKCVEFPLKWKFETTIMKNVSAVDNLLFEKDKIWWLFTNIDLSSTNYKSLELSFSELSIFYSKEGPLSNKWVAHKKNPVICNSLKSRNGGLIIEHEKFYRISQKVGFGIYGKEFELNEIINLNENEFEEKKLFSVKPSYFKNIYSTHHYHSDGSYTVIDFAKDDYFNLDSSVKKFK